MDLVQVRASVEDLNEELPGNRALFRAQFPHREVGPQGLAVVGQAKFQFGRNRHVLRAPIALGGKRPAEHGLREGLEVGQPGDSSFFRVELALFEAGLEQGLSLGVATVEDGARAHQRRSGDHQTRRLDEAEPLQVREDGRIELRHQFVSGQR